MRLYPMKHIVKMCFAYFTRIYFPRSRTLSLTYDAPGERSKASKGKDFLPPSFVAGKAIAAATLASETRKQVQSVDV